MFVESSPTIHEELGRLRQADRLTEARERHATQFSVERRAASHACARATLRRVRAALATAVQVSSKRRPPTTPVAHH